MSRTVLTPAQSDALATVRAAQASRRSISEGRDRLGRYRCAGAPLCAQGLLLVGRGQLVHLGGLRAAAADRRFEKDTGIKLNVTTFSSNEDCLNKLKAAGGGGWDLASPSIAWISAHVDNGSLGALDESKLPNEHGQRSSRA